MRNSIPKYDLTAIQKMIIDGNFRITSSALIDAAMIDYDSKEIKRIVLSLVPKDFYKSMPSHKNEMFWQDVYHKTIQEDGITLYIKLQIVKDAIIISFKEK
ncbi:MULTISPECIES: type II toxin-antitoxin system MqsR family toxin [unclassified Sulfuricurvum]|uniref:type II toxin-antitoxin system MqsR family toxin n=1 Tax=unclassified Sulfuricurvum TaxID=2632390 RepID=UPI000A60B283|nr:MULTISPECIES: type II toxin-antitoxin system MqsR family toxin [unclassified Sulfuricurvum]